MPDRSEEQRRNRFRIILGVILGAFLAALDTTILATVMPTIVTDLGGLSLYSWVFSIYMIMTAVSMPLWGKMSDMFGRRNLFVASVVVFLLGSVLCGVASSMLQLIIFRGIQGIGAGGLSAIPFALISAVFPAHERGKAIGFISSTWGVSSVLGPVLGSFIALQMDWRWVFYINIPLGVAAVIIVWRYYSDTIPHHKERIDYAGGVLLTLSIVSLLMTSVTFGKTGTHLSFSSLAYLGAFILFTVLFVIHERRAQNPILHIEFFRLRKFWLGNLLGFLASFTMYGVIAFMPLFSQSVQGGTAVQAGLVITPMSLGWSISSVLAGRFAYRLGERNLIRFGMFIMFCGFLLTALFLEQNSPVWFLVLCVTLCGIGMGCQTPALLLTVQNSLELKNLGVATSSQMLSRTIGGAIGVSILGAVLSGSMTRHFGELGEEGGARLSEQIRSYLNEPQELLSQHVRSLMTHAELDIVLRTFTDAIHAVFMIGLCVITASLLLSILLPPASRTGSRAQDKGPGID